MGFNIRKEGIFVWPEGRQSVLDVVETLIKATVPDEQEAERIIRNGHINLSAETGQRIFAPLASCPFILGQAAIPSRKSPLLKLTLLREHPEREFPRIFLTNAGFYEHSNLPVAPDVIVDGLIAP